VKPVKTPMAKSVRVAADRDQKNRRQRGENPDAFVEDQPVTAQTKDVRQVVVARQQTPEDG
jgi:hypothetical protein